MSMTSTVTKLPTAATSYVTIVKARAGWNVALLTPAGAKPIRTVLARCSDRAAAVDHASRIAEQMKRPLQIGGAA